MNQRKFLEIPRCATKNSPSDFKPVVISLKDQKNIYLGNKTLKSQRPQVKTFLKDFIIFTCLTIIWCNCVKFLSIKLQIYTVKLLFIYSYLAICFIFLTTSFLNNFLSWLWSSIKLSLFKGPFNLQPLF